MVATGALPISLFRQHQPISREGEAATAVYQLVEGWACRHRTLRDGRRQITAVFLPGDYCEPQWLLEPVVRQSIFAASSVRVRPFPIATLGTGRGDAKALETILSSLLATLDRQAEWLVRLGRNTALERMSALLCELFDRMGRAEMVYGRQCAMPLTQIELADILGLTSVHVNRVLKELRALGLVELQSKWLHLPDPQALRRLAGLRARPADEAPEAVPAHSVAAVG